MKKFSILAAVACLLCLAAPAVAGKSIKYKGKADPDGRVAFTLLKGDGKMVDAFKWAKIPVDCGGKGEQTTSNQLGFTIKVKEDRTFSAKAILGPTDAPDAKVKVDGKVKGSGAFGTLHLRGKALPLDGGKTADCKSGPIDWNAEPK